MKDEKQLERIETDVGKIEVPLKRVENSLCLRVHLGTATLPDGTKWSISHSGGAVIVDVPNELVYYYVLFGDIVQACIEKHKQLEASLKKVE